MKFNLILLLSCFLFLMAFGPGKEDEFINDNFSNAKTQLTGMLAQANNRDTLFPRSIDAKGNAVFVNKYDWTSGFFPGELWYLYEATRDPALQKEAARWTEKLDALKNFTGHHDLGFMVYCSFGNAYRITKNEQYKEVVIQAARSLSTRFNPKTGSIKSWDGFGSWDAKGKYNFPVIIDNMMNLELLFFASNATGDPSYKNIAVTHALNVIKNQVRNDYSCYHVVCYDSTTGTVLTRETGQGFSNNSAWARGQAWGIYGFTMTYRETGDKRFLKTAKGMADFYLDNPELPQDKVAYWDFYANNPGYNPSVKSKALQTPAKYRDASAAAVTASALMELAGFVEKDGDKYRNAAIAILHSLGSPVYRAKEGENGNFILKHSVGSIPHGSEIDVPLVYADYYFLEALHRYQVYLKNTK